MKLPLALAMLLSALSLPAAAADSLVYSCSLTRYTNGTNPLRETKTIDINDDHGSINLVTGNAKGHVQWSGGNVGNRGLALSVKSTENRELGAVTIVYEAVQKVILYSVRLGEAGVHYNLECDRQ